MTKVFSSTGRLDRQVSEKRTAFLRVARRSLSLGLRLFCGLLWLAGLVATGPGVRAETLPQEIAASDVSLFNVDSETVPGSFGGMLLIPRSATNYRDEKYKEPYHLACHVYMATPAPDAPQGVLYKRRFVVCARDREALPFVRQAARLFLLLCAERRERIRDDHPANLPVVNVWITEGVEQGLSPDTGGEQFQNQIYLYDRRHERAPLEWAREIAHEYGHYALPGISGFKAPEEWANGVLGERLFLKWLREDLRSGALKPGDLPLVTPDLLNSFYVREVRPLVQRIERDGVDTRILARLDAAGMDYYTGLALYVDSLYGSRMLVEAMQDTHSASGLTFPHAVDFLNGVLRSLRTENEFALSLSDLTEPGKETRLEFYLPAGKWKVTAQGGVRSWQLASGVKTSGPAQKPATVTVEKAGWQSLTIARGPGAAVPARLFFRK